MKMTKPVSARSNINDNASVSTWAEKLISKGSVRLLLCAAAAAWTLVAAIFLIYMKSWIRNDVKEIVAEDNFKKEIEKALSSNFVTLAYPSSFLLSKDNPEHYLPVYIGANNFAAELFLRVVHQGPPKEPWRKIKLLVDSKPLEIPELNEETGYKQTISISLTDHLERLRKSGVHDFGDEIFFVGFRADPTHTTNDAVSISALVIVHGLDQGGK